jgi:Fe-S oxidoreductase
MEKYLKNFKNCLQKEIPYCAAECPFHLDIPDFIEKMKRGGFRGAFKSYRDTVGFPLIASELCHAPCKGVCPRKDTDSAIELLMLEKACISFTADRSPTDYNLPTKKKKIAVIGAGISGLACALRLCMKKYEVEVFEATGRIGGYLWELMDPDAFLSDIETQFKHENYVINFYTPVEKPEDLKGRGFDAVFAATGEGGIDFGLTSTRSGAALMPDALENRNCAIYDGAGWFAGGGLIGEKPIDALANGLNMGTVIDNFLKTGKLLNPENTKETCMQLDPAKLKRTAALPPENGISFSEEEAKIEASRCLECQCDFCRSYCDLTDFYHKWPLRIRDEIMATTLPGSADVKATPAKRLLSTCNQCGLCKEVCPEEIDLGGLILEGRKSMHRQKKAPWVFHDFWLRDMEFANSERAALIMSPPRGEAAEKTTAGMEKKGCGYAFFPGCQLGASDPELIGGAYRYLLKRQPDTGLVLRCCGAPAEWAGDEDKFDGELAAIRSAWTELGKPIMILACPTCIKKFKTYLTEIPVRSLYEIIAEWGFDLNGRSAGTYSVFDACAARHEPGMKTAVRTLAETTGYQLEPLAEHEAQEQCCSFGGQPGVANPEFAAFVVEKRIRESENPYIVYCVNCRDAFLDAGKESVHILNILFGDSGSAKMLPTVTERRENRARLREDLLKEFWHEQPTDMKKQPKRNLKISEELKRKISRERILEDDLAEVINFCEQSGRRTWLPESGTYSGYREIGRMTYWVEYRALETKAPDTASAVSGNSEEPRNSGYELVNAYAHRMKIELEAVWKGKKTGLDQE